MKSRVRQRTQNGVKPSRVLTDKTSLALGSRGQFPAEEGFVGFNDHRKHWAIEVKATPAECEDAFRSAFTKESGRFAKKANFTVEWMDDTDDGRCLVARYDGRAGFAAVAAAISKAASRMQDSARGSSIAMRLDQSEENPDIVGCELWLKRRRTVLGPLGTTEVGILRAYLQGARDRVASLDPSATVWSM